MTTIPKKKICWNCDGRVSVQEENCPYCGVYISGTLDMQEKNDSQYSEEEENAIPPPAYVPEEQKNTAQSILPETDTKKIYNPTTTKPKELLSLALLLIGSVFFLFAIILLLFSHNGTFSLHWDASLWFVYLLISIPALYFGWRYLESVQE